MEMREKQEKQEKRNSQRNVQKSQNVPIWEREQGVEVNLIDLAQRFSFWMTITIPKNVWSQTLLTSFFFTAP